MRKKRIVKKTAKKKTVMSTTRPTQVEPLPDRIELSMFLDGELDRKQAAAIRRMARSKDPHFDPLREDLKFISDRMKQTPPPLKKAALKELTDRFVRQTESRHHMPMEGDIWTIKNSRRQVLVLLRDPQHVRTALVAPLAEFAGPLDVVLRDREVSAQPVLIELFASRWMKVADLEHHRASVPQQVLPFIQRADRGVTEELPESLTRGMIQEDSGTEEYIDMWREEEQSFISRYEVALDTVLRATEEMLGTEPSLLVPMLVRAKNIVLHVKDALDASSAALAGDIVDASFLQPRLLFAFGATSNLVTELLRIESQKEAEGRTVFHIAESEEMTLWFTRIPGRTLFLRAEFGLEWTGRSAVDRIIVSTLDETVIADVRDVQVRLDQLAWEMPAEVRSLDVPFLLALIVGERTETFRIEPKRMGS